MAAGIIASISFWEYRYVGLHALNSANSWTLTTIPLFVLVGTLSFTECGRRIYRASAAYIGRIPGGLLQPIFSPRPFFRTYRIEHCAPPLPPLPFPKWRRGYDEKLSFVRSQRAVLGSLIPQ
jgi:hypothetical protein